MLMNVITFEAISAFIAGSPCIRHLRVRSDRTYNSCQDIHGIPMKVTLASLGAWMRTCRTRKPFSGVLNNTHAIRYWMQFASAHCANTGGVYGASTHWKRFRSLIVAGTLFATRTPIGRRNWRVRSWCQVHPMTQWGPAASTSKSRMPQVSRTHLSASEKALAFSLSVRCSRKAGATKARPTDLAKGH